MLAQHNRTIAALRRGHPQSHKLDADIFQDMPNRKDPAAWNQKIWGPEAGNPDSWNPTIWQPALREDELLDDPDSWELRDFADILPGRAY